MPKKTVKAFTLLELLVVIAILGIFTVVAYPNISKWITDREVKKVTYEVVTYIEELKAGVQNGQYGMVHFNLNPNLHAEYWTNDYFTSTYKGFSNNKYKNGKYCEEPWSQKNSNAVPNQIGFQLYANDRSSSFTSYPSDQSFDRKIGGLCITKDSSIKFKSRRGINATETDTETAQKVDIFIICHRSLSPNQGDCRPDQNNDFRYKITFSKSINMKIYKYSKTKKKWIKIDG